MGERPGVLFRFELLDALEQLDPADAGQLFIAAMRYGKSGTAPTFQNPLLSVVWSFIKTAVDHDAEVYDGKILQRQHAVYCRECKRKGETPMDFDTWKSSSDIDRCVPITNDIHYQHQDHTHTHSHTQKQEHNQEDSAATPPPAPARDTDGIICISDEDFGKLQNELGKPELDRVIGYLGSYCASTGKRYANWAATVRRASAEGWGATSKPASNAPKAIQPGVDLQPDAKRIQQHNDWIDGFLAEQAAREGKDG